MDDLVKRARACAKDQHEWADSSNPSLSLYSVLALIGSGPYIMDEMADRIEELEELYRGCCEAEDRMIHSYKTKSKRIKELEAQLESTSK